MSAHVMMKKTFGTRERKIAAGGVAVLAGALAVGGLSSLYGAPEAVSPTQGYSVGTGKFEISLAPETTRTWAQKVPAMAAGDKVYTYVKMANESDVEIGSVTVKALPGGALLRGASPMEVRLEACSKAWSKSGDCVGKPIDLFPSASRGTHEVSYRIPAHGIMYVKATAELPSKAEGIYQSSVGTMGYEFTAEQATDESSFPQPESR